MKLVIFKKDMYICSLAVCIAFGLSLFYLVNTEAFHVAGQFNFDAVTFLVTVIWGVFVMLWMENCEKVRYEFGLCMGMVLLLSVTSSLQAYFLYGQSFVQGMIPQRSWLLWGFMYFPIRKALGLSNITLQQVKNMITYIGTLELILFTLQYLLSSKVTFLYILSGTRYGSARFYFQSILLVLLLFIKLDEVLVEKKFWNCIYVVWILFEIMVIQKYRLSAMGLAMTIFIGIMISKQDKIIKLISICVGAVGGLILMKTQMFQDIITTLTASNTANTTLSVRENARNWYLAALKIHSFLGAGYTNINNENALYASGNTQKFFFSDNGIYGLAFLYGLLGLLFFAWLWIKFFKKGYCIYKKKGIAMYMLFPLFFCITAIHEAHWYWQNGFMVLVLFICMLEAQEKELDSMEQETKKGIESENDTENIY